MKRINFLHINEYDVYHKIACGRRKSRKCIVSCYDYNTDKCNTCDFNYSAVMLKIEEYVFKRYKAYEDNIDNLALVKSERILTEHQAKVLKETFSSTVFKRTRSAVFNNLPSPIKGTCPFCLIGEPDTLEHYLPKEVFPEFSIFTKNLIPCCSRCNSLKGLLYLNSDGTRSIINYYVDDINSISFLKTKIYFAEDCKIPIIEYMICIDDDNRLAPIIKGHFTQLQLLRRYSERAESELVSIIDTILRLLNGNDLDVLIEKSLFILNSKMETLGINYGRNYWVVSLYHCLINDRDLLKTIIERNLK